MNKKDNHPKKVNQICIAAILFITIFIAGSSAFCQNILGGWSLTGNAGTNGNMNFIGTTDNVPLNFKVNSKKAGRIDVLNSCTFFGFTSGNSNIGNNNTAFGFESLFSNTSGTSNTAIGNESLFNNILGRENTAIGFRSLFNNTTNAGNESGSNNTAIGFQALFANNTGSNNTAVGHNAFSTGIFSNSMALGANTTISASNQVHIGDASITSIQGKVSFTTYSDGRIKNNVQENIPGLAFIKELRPVSYNYDIHKENKITGNADNSEWEGKYDIEKIRFSGFIAQEVDAAANKIGYNFSGVDKSGTLWGLRYAEFVVPLVKAVQEQQKIIDSQQSAISNLKMENENLSTQISQLSSRFQKIEQQFGMNAQAKK